MSLRLRILFSYTFICLVWGSTWAFVQLGLQTVPPILSAALRFLIATIILGAIMRILSLRIPRSKSFWILVCSISLSAFIIPFGLIYWGQTKINSSLASLLFATFPFWAALLSHIFLTNERITLFRAYGIVIGFIGVSVIFGSDSHIFDSVQLLGMWAVLLSALLSAVALIIIRKYGLQYSSITLNFFSMFFGALVLLVTSVFLENYSQLILDLRSIGSLLYLSLVGTVGTFVTYFWLLKYVDAVVLSLSAFITPIIAVLIGMMWFHEILTVYSYVGASLVLLGILISNSKELSSLIAIRIKSARFYEKS